jgi:hypothetical protein
MNPVVAKDNSLLFAILEWYAFFKVLLLLK